MWASVCGAIVGLSLMLMSANREAAPAAAPTVFLTRQERQVGDVVAVMTVANVFALLLLVTDRYWTSVSIGAALIALLWAGNRLKVAILNEVLVFSDIFLAGHALRYPRLYFGYAPKWVWPVVIAGGAALGWCLTIEAPMNVLTDGERLGFVGLWLGGGGLMVVRMAKPSGRIKSFLSHYPMSFDTQTDAWAYTPLGAALLHVLRHGQYRHAVRERFAKIKGESVRSFDGKHTPALGHRLLIQAESFVPIGALLDRPSRMPAIDELMCRSTSGALKLDWRGAYTMRTEFAVLTGIAPRELETYGFDPYRLAAMMPMQSLAWQLKAQGYRTVVCHPNDARFFERDKVMKNLGFDEFIDLSVLQTKLIRNLYPDKHVFTIGKHEDKLEKFTFANAVETIFSRTNRKYDVLIECVGGSGAQNAINDMIESALPKATLLLTGVSEIPPAVNTRSILEKGLTLRGTTRSIREDFLLANDFLKSAKNRSLVNMLDTVHCKVHNSLDLRSAFEAAKSSKFKTTIEFLP